MSKIVSYQRLELPLFHQYTIETRRATATDGLDRRVVVVALVEASTSAGRPRRVRRHRRDLLP